MPSCEESSEMAFDEIKAIHIIPRKLTGSHRTYLAIDISVKFFKGLASTKLLKFQLQLITLNLNSMQKNISENRGWFPFPLIMPTRIMITSNLKEVQVLLLFSSISTFQIITLDDS
jgi:hypothetical protein